MHNTVQITQDTQLYPLCEACSVFATHNKFIVEVLEKNIRSSEFIDHSFERNFMERAMGCIKNLCAGQALRFSSHLYLTRCMIIVRHTHILSKKVKFTKNQKLCLCR